MYGGNYVLYHMYIFSIYRVSFYNVDFFRSLVEFRFMPNLIIMYNVNLDIVVLKFV